MLSIVPEPNWFSGDPFADGMAPPTWASTDLIAISVNSMQGVNRALAFERPPNTITDSVVEHGTPGQGYFVQEATQQARKQGVHRAGCGYKLAGQDIHSTFRASLQLLHDMMRII